MRFLIYLCLFPFIGLAQTFTAEGGVIKDSDDNHLSRTIFPLVVSGLPILRCDSFGLAEICINVRHGELSDLKISLRNPSGTEVWLSNRNGKGSTAFINTCFSADTPNGFIFNARSFNNNHFIPDGNLENFYDNTSPNGTWNLIVEDLRPEFFGILQSFSVTFSTDVACSPSICELTNIKDCKCTNGQDTCELLPDLIILEKYTKENIAFFDKNDKEYPNQIRFAAAMGNIGEGPLETVPSKKYYCNGKLIKNAYDCRNGVLTEAIMQNIFTKQGDGFSVNQIEANKWYFDDTRGHNHYHVEDWVDYFLLEKRWWTNNPKFWKVIAKSEKVSYCLMDSNYCLEKEENCTSDGLVYFRKNLLNFGLGNYSKCDQNKQGISVGGIDNYGIMYEGQHIKTPGDLTEGKYYLYLKLDPKNYYKESNDKNNNVLIPIELKKTADHKLKLVVGAQ